MPEERWSDMPMKEIPRIPEEEAEKLKGSRFVESVDGHMVLLTLEFHLMMYKRWKEFPSVHTVQEFMRRNGIDPDVLGQLYAEALVWDFETYGDPTVRPYGGIHAPHQPVERRNDVALLSTGKFYMAGRSFKWDKEFKKELRACYPMMTVEDSLMQAGINPALIDNARIRTVTHRFKQDEERRQTDKGRRTYHNFYSDTKWGDSRAYDLIINSSKLGIQGTVEIIRSFAEAFKEA